MRMMTTLCYLEQNDSYLMLHRIKKKNDLNEGKWIGVGGHVEAGETPEMCIRRETKEETGLTLKNCRLRGVVEFLSERWEDETMFVYTSDQFSGMMSECNEGELCWVPRKDIFSLNLWEGDKIFLEALLSEAPFFHLALHYDAADQLVSAQELPKIVLASGSPRRQQLLGQIGIEPVILPSSCEERRTTDDPEQLVCELSRQKAEDVAAQFPEGVIVIGADTMVFVDGKLLGKPGTHEEAAEMVRAISGRTHQVYTGVTMIRTGGETCCFAEKTDVHVASMTEEEILRYAGSEEPMDKAGAYGVQGAFSAYIEGISGDYYNVMGLPVHRVYEALKKLDLKSEIIWGS